MEWGEDFDHSKQDINSFLTGHIVAINRLQEFWAGVQKLEKVQNK
jgi:hypothetical protein